MILLGFKVSVAKDHALRDCYNHPNFYILHCLSYLGEHRDFKFGTWVDYS